MALTKEDIDAVIAQTENQDAIRHFIAPTHYFENLDEPVAVAIGITKSGARGALESTNINNVVGVLRKNGIDAVSMLDKEATDPAKFVVNESGVLTPFMKPEDALKATALICDICLNSDQHLNGYANLQTKETLLYSASVNALDERRNIDIQKGHPHPEKFEEISSKYNQDTSTFIDGMVQEAVHNLEVINQSTDFIENYANGYEYIWRGATLGGKPYAAIFPSNDRKVAYASPNLATSSGYTGCVPTSSGAGGAQYPMTKSGLHYGFLYKFKTLGDKQRYHPDTGLQSATGGHYIDENIKQVNTPSSKEDFETGILPHCNQLKAIYLHVQSENDFDAKNIKVYKIELDNNGKAKDPRWQDFLDLHEPTDSSVRGNIAERQDTQKREQDVNPNNAYSFELQDNLPEKNYEHEHFTSLDYLKTIAFKSQIIENKDEISVAGDIKLPPSEDLSTKDLSDITIDGKLDFMGLGYFTSFEHFPKTKNGIYHSVFIGDLDNETTESLLSKVKGIDWVEKYTHRAEDGHLIIDGEPLIKNETQAEGKRVLDFSNIAYSSAMYGIIDMPSLSINPTSWPKDVLNVEFNCDVNFNRTSMSENMASKLKNLPSLEQLEDFDKMTLRIDELRKQKDNVHGLHLSIPQKLDLSQYKCSNIECEGHTHIIELPSSVEVLSYNNVDDMKQAELPERLDNVSDLSFNKVSANSIDIKQNVSLLRIDSSNMNVNILGTINSLIISNSEVMLNNTGQRTQKLEMYNTKLKEGAQLDLSKCSQVNLSNCSLPKNFVLDLSKCENVRLENVDLSGATVIPPQQGRVYIGENVKFAPDYKLDLSHCAEGEIHPSLQCAELKLPQKLTSTNCDDVRLPQGVKEITTSCIGSWGVGKFNIPPHVKIVDTKDENGKKVPLKRLKAKGLSSKQITNLRKERILAPVKKLVAKVMPSKTTKNSSKQAKPKVDIVQQDKERLASLSGRDTVKRHAVQSNAMTVQPQVQQPAQPQIQPVAVKQAPEAVKDMSQKEKGRFFHKLRMGINTLLTKAETQFSRTKEAPQIQKTDINVQAAIKNKGRE